VDGLPTLQRSRITEYKYAKRQGFAGSFADFIQHKRTGAPPPAEE
jgi:hypothetical protein